MLMADPARALAETRRVLRDGGRLALSVWGPPQRNGWASIPGRALVEHTGAPPPDPDSPGMFALADSERVRSLLRDAGLGEPRLEEVEVTWRFEDFDDFWRFVTELAGGLAIVLRAMPEQDRSAVRESIERNVEGFRAGGGLEFPGVALNAYAG
jgi:SAM-dependent methyltransferase